MVRLVFFAHVRLYHDVIGATRSKVQREQLAAGVVDRLSPCVSARGHRSVTGRGTGC
jgi:hypothetical protein